MTSSPTAFDLVVFDLDGTLVDTLPDIAWSVGALMDELGLAAPSFDTVRGFVGDGARELIKRALPDGGAQHDVDALLARFVTHYAGHLCVDSRPYPGVLEALEALGRAGLSLGVVTNKPGGLARGLLGALRLEGAFIDVIGDGDGYPRKPDPAAAQAVVAHARTSPARTAVVGDGLPDVRLAHALGATAIAATWGYVPADRLRLEKPQVVATTPADVVRALLG